MENRDSNNTDSRGGLIESLNSIIMALNLRIRFLNNLRSFLIRTKLKITNTPEDESNWSKNFESWFKKSSTTAISGVDEEWNFVHSQDNSILSPLAKKLRREYCVDEEIDILRELSGKETNSEYLRCFVFSQKPSIRSGEFGEFLVANFMEHKKNFYVPPSRFINKNVPHETTMGHDIIGINEGKEEMIICEVKTALTYPNKDRLGKALKKFKNKSFDLGVSLHAIKNRMNRSISNFAYSEEARILQDFQVNGVAKKQLFAFIILIDSKIFKGKFSKCTKWLTNNRTSNYSLYIIKSDNLENFVVELYERAADETHTPI